MYTDRVVLIENSNEFINLLLSPNDNSLEISSMIGNVDISDLSRTLQHFMDGHGNDLNLLAFLMPNCNTNPTPSVLSKFNAFAKCTGSYLRLFERLLRIIQNDEHSIGYHQMCLNIIYHFFNDIGENTDILNKNDILSLVNKILNTTNNDNFYMTQFLKILVMYLESPNDKVYQDTKAYVLEYTNFKYTYDSAVNVSYNSIVKLSDSHFFELAFILKQNLVTAFKNEFTKYIETHKVLGDYWKHEILLSTQLFYQLAQRQGLINTCEFILLAMNADTKITSSFITTTFDEFNALFHELDVSDMLLINELTNELIQVGGTINRLKFMKLFKNTTQIRKLLFGRYDVTSKSLFENILSTPFEQANGYVLDYIWSEFRLSERPELLTHVCI